MNIFGRKIAYFLAAFIFVAGTIFGYFFRDGLGPNMVDSEGVVALVRLAEAAWPVWLLSLVLVLLGRWLGYVPRST